ncbi:hypothetical protein Dimus_021077, partial [Dionaea muscipula]
VPDVGSSSTSAGGASLLSALGVVLGSSVPAIPEHYSSAAPAIDIIDALHSGTMVASTNPSNGVPMASESNNVANSVPIASESNNAAASESNNASADSENGTSTASADVPLGNLEAMFAPADIPPLPTLAPLAPRHPMQTRSKSGIFKPKDIVQAVM